MQVKDHELASALMKGEAVQFPPSKAYARLVDHAPMAFNRPESGT